MKKGFLLGVLVTVVLGFLIPRFMPGDRVPHGELSPVPSEDGWVNLLEGEHAAKWKNITDDKEIFTLEEGVIHILGSNLPIPLRYVGYDGIFGDYDLHLEFKLSSRANSGVFLRTQPGDTTYRGFEIQVLDDFGTAPNNNGSGSIYDVATPMYNMAFPAGEWNSYDISLEGGEVEVHMNGWRVLHTDLSKMTMPIGKFDAPFSALPRTGGIAFQDHGGEVWYRNIYIRERGK